MPIAPLYALTVAIWGSTWLAIHFQLGVVHPAWSIAYRFLIASLCFGLLAVVLRRPLNFPRAAHGLFLAMGFFLYCSNYILTYAGSERLVTGVVAVLFSLIPLGNALWGAAVLKTPISRNVFGGATLGLGGIALLFWPQLAGFDLSSDRLVGLLLVLLAVALASTGNMVAAVRQKRGLPIIETNFWAMLYGAGLTAIYALAAGGLPTFEASWSYVISLAYLAVFGSVVAFSVYITLIERIGLAQAGYALVLTPVVALSLSTFFEGFHWSAVSGAGVALCIAGNVLMVRRRAKA